MAHVCQLGPAPKEDHQDASLDTFGLTPEEKQIIADIWAPVGQDLEGNGVVVLVTYFRDYPHNLKYFPFKDEPIDNLANHPLVKRHAIRVLRELSSIVANINKPNTLLHGLRQNAINHRKRAIHKEAYDELRLTIVKVLKIAIKDLFNDKAEQAYNKLFNIIFKVITDICSDETCICANK